ncbi:MAG: hypothetical protein KF830_14105, partial [Planctomycetes bacterium]|nr:hypothetical protein [Planctomycetota bacterium]
VPTADAAAVVRALGLRTVLPANWSAGLAGVRHAGVFVTPPVGGFVLAVGADLRGAGADLAAFVPPLLERLAAAFGRAAWFLTDAAAEHHGWALAADGALVRGYAHDGVAGELFWHGEVTAAERRLGCFLADPRDRSEEAGAWWPDERIVCDLAAAWSVDPRRLDGAGAAPGSGWVGRL